MSRNLVYIDTIENEIEKLFYINATLNKMDCLSDKEVAGLKNIINDIINALDQVTNQLKP